MVLCVCFFFPNHEIPQDIERYDHPEMGDDIHQSPSVQWTLSPIFIGFVTLKSFEIFWNLLKSFEWVQICVIWAEAPKRPPRIWTAGLDPWKAWGNLSKRNVAWSLKHSWLRNPLDGNIWGNSSELGDFPAIDKPRIQTVTLATKHGRIEMVFQLAFSARDTPHRWICRVKASTQQQWPSAYLWTRKII